MSEPPFVCGDIVALKSKPSRQGRVVAVIWTFTIRVKWLDDHRKSEHDHADLVIRKKLKVT